MKNSKKLKLSVQEIIFYSISVILALWGIVEIILGLIVEFANVRIDEFPLYQAEQAYISLFGMSFTNWGLVLLAIGLVVGVIVLCIYATRHDREVEKTVRREARLNAQRKILDVEVEEK